MSVDKFKIDSIQFINRPPIIGGSIAGMRISASDKDVLDIVDDNSRVRIVHRDGFVYSLPKSSVYVVEKAVPQEDAKTAKTLKQNRPVI